MANAQRDANVTKLELWDRVVSGSIWPVRVFSRRNDNSEVEMAEGLEGVPRFLTVAEVADAMRVSKMTVYRMIHSSQMPAVRMGRSFRVPRKAVDDLIAQGYEAWEHAVGEEG